MFWFVANFPLSEAGKHVEWLWDTAPPYLYLGSVTLTNAIAVAGIVELIVRAVRTMQSYSNSNDENDHLQKTKA